MDIKKFYYSKRINQWYYAGINCDICNNKLDSISFAIIKHPKRFKSQPGVLCHKCVREERDKSGNVINSIEFRQVRVIKEQSLPVDAFFSPIRKIDLGSNVNSFEAAISNKGIKSDTSSTIIKDYTRLAGRESFEGSQIGLDPEEIEDKQKVLSDEAVDEFLEWSKNPDNHGIENKKTERIDNG